jgi:hypothetical protein
MTACCLDPGLHAEKSLNLDTDNSAKYFPWKTIPKTAAFEKFPAKGMSDKSVGFVAETRRKHSVYNPSWGAKL